MVDKAAILMLKAKDSEKARLDRRQSSRKMMSLQVALIQDGELIENCAAKDISLGGMFISCNPIPFQESDIVEPEFWLHFGVFNRRCTIMAQIVRLGKHGIGLEFHRHNERYFRYVQKMLYEEPTVIEYVCGTQITYNYGPSQAHIYSTTNVNAFPTNIT